MSIAESGANAGLAGSTKSATQRCVTGTLGSCCQAGKASRYICAHFITLCSCSGMGWLQDCKHGACAVALEMHVSDLGAELQGGLLDE